jgi:hypothetical protein
MYVVLVREIIIRPLTPRRISYELATVTESGDFPTEINLNKLAWRSRKTERGFAVGDRTIRFAISVGRVAAQQTGHESIEVQYDNYYGRLGGAGASTYVPPTRIAIIHKDYLANNPIVDLRGFRFKTWEDGLGNRCDKGPSDPNAMSAD